MTVIVRHAKAKDVAALAALNEQVQRLHVAARPDQFVQTNRAALEAELARAIAQAHLKFWVAELGAEVAGYVVVRVRTLEPGPYLKARLFWELDQIGVEAAFRERGVARALVAAVAREAADAGVQSLELVCWSFNAEARAAFEKLGFSPKLVRMELEV